MNEEMRHILADLKARQDAGEHMPCPRCGYDRMKQPVHTNALSRQADIMVCDECGANEALRAYMNAPLPLDVWACFYPQRLEGDFKAVSGERAWTEIQVTQLPYLADLFTRWLDEPEQKDFGAYRREALANCKGLREIWEHPAQAVYEVSDGELILRFREGDSGIEVAHDVVGKK